MNGGREQQGVGQRRSAGRGTRRGWSAVPGKNDCHLYKQEAIIKMRTNQNNFKLDTIVSWVPRNKIVKFEVNSIKGCREIQRHTRVIKNNKNRGFHRPSQHRSMFNS